MNLRMQQKYHTIFVRPEGLCPSGRILLFPFGPLYRSNIFSKFLKKWCLAGSWQPSTVTLAEREKTTEIPTERGEKMETIPAMILSCGTAMMLSAKRYSAMRQVYLREMAHRREREKSLDASDTKRKWTKLLSRG